MNNNIKKLIGDGKFIGEGARRVVYDIGNGFVIKVAKSKYGIKSNKKEVFIYFSSPYSIRKHLGKIIDYGDEYRWIIMRKYNQNFPHSKKYKEKLYELRSKFSYYGIIPYEVVMRKDGNPNYNNLRVKNSKKIIVIDYGNFIWR
ncbi:hypothetical protein FHS19_000086 [Paenibacillus rhizosphaerae]|uniref:Protein kinase domain-containing protein n=1 Tax=Paenibacillus rhizosphaerae TaxID=297318 RepID=A0A839TFQ5_9BACL|nr:hypothetical protein [Paenibacillus rhizosphaerae]MBB3125432.1 hypothetical protein [Paenibacillus rhizosphaerae]